MCPHPTIIRDMRLPAFKSTNFYDRATNVAVTQAPVSVPSTQSHVAAAAPYAIPNVNSQAETNSFVLPYPPPLNY